MDFARGGNRQQQQPAPQKDAMGAQTPSPKGVTNNDNHMGLGNASGIVILIGTAILVLVLIFGLIFGDTSDGVNKESALINQDQYQAVFLDSQDGQVYFGKMAIFNKDLYVLTDIYYVRVENPIQPSDGTPAQANISLAKLGNELHAPEDIMYISRDKVLYWENLKDDGQVVSAITEYKANGGATQQQDTTQTQPANTPQQNDTPAETPAETPAP